jgi:heptosyltransferase-1
VSVNPRRILLVRLSHLGDVVHALPVFHALRAAHPEAEIGWAVQPEFAGLIEGMAGLSEIFRFERRGGARAWVKLLGEVRAWKPEWTVDAQGNAKSAMVTIGSGARRRSGMHRADWREPFAARVLTDSAAAVGKEVAHAMEKMLALARHVAPQQGEAAIGRADLGLSPAELEQGRALRTRFLPGESGPGVILHLSSPKDVRSWPPGHFEDLARELAGRGEPVLLLSGPEEEMEGRQLAQRLEGSASVRHWVGQRGLRTLAAFFASAGESGARMVVCDSGPMHLAVACGLPVICLAGPQDERRTGPWMNPTRGRAQRTIRARASPPCAPCLARKCEHPLGTVCMRDLAPMEVGEALGEAS